MEYFVITRGFGDNSFQVKQFSDLQPAKDHLSGVEIDYLKEYEDDQYARNCFFGKITKEIEL